jgi:hypothetical protein
VKGSHLWKYFFIHDKWGFLGMDEVIGNGVKNLNGSKAIPKNLSRIFQLLGKNGMCLTFSFLSKMTIITNT